MINNNRLNFINNKNEENRYKRYTEITRLWDNFKMFHYKHPELRAGQLFSIFENWYHSVYGNDIFYTEDEALNLYFEEFMSFSKRGN